MFFSINCVWPLLCFAFLDVLGHWNSFERLLKLFFAHKKCFSTSHFGISGYCTPFGAHSNKEFTHSGYSFFFFFLANIVSFIKKKKNSAFGLFLHFWMFHTICNTFQTVSKIFFPPKIFVGSHLFFLWFLAQVHPFLQFSSQHYKLLCMLYFLFVLGNNSNDLSKSSSNRLGENCLHNHEQMREKAAGVGRQVFFPLNHWEGVHNQDDNDDTHITP